MEKIKDKKLEEYVFMLSKEFKKIRNNVVLDALINAKSQNYKLKIGNTILEDTHKPKDIEQKIFELETEGDYTKFEPLIFRFSKNKELLEEYQKIASEIELLLKNWTNYLKDGYMPKNYHVMD